MPEISHQQAEALRALEWLFSANDDHRREGRSFTMALAYVRFAFNELTGERLGVAGNWVRVVDHMHHAGMNQLDGSRIILAYVEGIARDAGLLIESNDARSRFRITGLREGFVPDFPQHYLFEEFVETDIQRGVPEDVRRQMGFQVGRRAGMTTAGAAHVLQRFLEDQMERGEARRRPPAPEEPQELPVPLRWAVVEYVGRHPGQTATQIAHALDALPASVSSVLVREVDRHSLRRVSGQGPRGGWVYFPVVPVTPPERVVGPSVWERLRQNLFSEDAEDSDAPAMAYPAR